MIRPAPCRSARVAAALALLLPWTTVAAPQDRLEEARNLSARDDLAGAARVLTEGLRHAPGDADLAAELSSIEARRGRYLASLEAVRRTLGLRPGDPPAVASLRRILKPLIGQIRERLKSQPGDPEAVHAAAYLFAVQGRQARAEKQLISLTASHPGYAPGWQDRAWLALAAGRAKEAYEHASRAFELDPGSPVVRRHLRIAGAARTKPEEHRGDEFYGVLRPEASETSPEAPTPPVNGPAVSAGGTPPARIDFGRVNLEDDELVASLLARIEAETLGPGGADPVPAPPDPAPEVKAPVQPPPEPLSVPTPLEVMKRLQESYDAGVEAMARHDYEAAEKKLGLVTSLRPEYRDTSRRMQEIEAALDSLHELEQAKILLEGGEGAKSLVALRKVRPKLAAAARPDVDLAALEGLARFLTKDFDGAAKKLRVAVGRAPQDAPLRHKLFLSLIELNRDADALTELAMLDKAAPGFAKRQDGYGKRIFRLYVRRYFLVLVAVALLWFGSVIGYLLFFGRRKHRTDVWGDHSEAVQDALRRGDGGSALAALVPLDALALEDERRHKIAAWRVQAMLQEEQPDAAEEALQSLESATGETAATRLLKGRLAMARGDASPATRPLLFELLQAEPSNQELLEMLHEATWADNDRGTEAREVLQRLLEINPENLDWLGREVECRAEDRDRSESAVKLYRRMLRFEDRHPLATKGLASALLEAGKPLDALPLVKDGLQSSPGDVDLAAMAGRAFRESELVDEGIRYLERIAGRGGEGVAAELEHLRRLQSQVQDEIAQDREEERQIGGSYDEGVKLFSQGRYAEALPSLEAAVGAGSYRKHAGALIVKSHLALGDTPAAWERFGTLDLELTPGDEFMVGLCYDMAKALQVRDDYQSARDLYRQVCRADVEYKDAFERFEELEEQLQLNS